MYRMSNSFPFLLDNSFLTAGQTIVFSEATIHAAANYTPIPAQQNVSWSPVVQHVLLRNMGKKYYLFGTNRLKTYEFRRVQLIQGAGTEGVGNAETGYICVWAASGVAPISF